ncbi:Bug family tripartite tricarboxylate transporter substrate binding protein [Pseudorhodoferax soli]|uniref:Tripartite-type tricarboxylate transporter receptor subunit TctC n=1 Tax=Pseudorhodoferax soli TaxID=545864 RepID=A0A368XA51_9BURK|nr:tripartite tricarboxylate transporter substrate binding protein [Pseudorhodoferax soli]RCW64116.1 tripartite-type tricarboxylate transporter receptor subunit TctC [Pseudorhodoferax soli]
MDRRSFSRWGAAAALAPALVLAGTGPAGAQGYPDKPIRLVVPYAPGGIADTLARRLADALRNSLHQPVVVENKPGANTAIGAIQVASAPADGYTLLLATAGTAVLNPMLIPNLRYNPATDFTAVANVAVTPLVLTVNANGPVQTLADLVRLAKAEPGKLAYASPGTGSSTHLAMEILLAEAGISMIHVPFAGSAPSMNSVLAGDTQASIDSVASTAALIKGGKLRPIAVTTRERVAVLPQVPTVAESGVAGYNVSTWYGVLAPAGTPAAVVERLNQAIVQAQAEKPFREQFEALGLVIPPPLKPAAFNDYMQAERAVWGPLIQAKNIRIE